MKSWLWPSGLIVLTMVVIVVATAAAELAGFAGGSFFLGVLAGLVIAQGFYWCAEWLAPR